MIGAIAKATHTIVERKIMETGYAVQAESAQSDYRQMKTPKTKNLGFFKRWLLKSVKEAVDHERNQPVPRDELVSIKQARGLQAGPPSIDQPERAIQFTVYVANGGRVVETRRYERKTDRHSNGLYVITSDQDFGREIDKILTQEALR